MVSYKTGSFMQAILIVISGISMFDSGYDDTDIMNDRLFSDGNQFWNWYAFLAYCFFIVGIIQLIKNRP